MKWQKKQDLIKLLTKLIEFPSISGSPDESAISEYVYRQLQKLDYYKNNPEHLMLNPINDGRRVLSALVKSGESKETVILLCHVDVVDVEDFGKWKSLAFRPNELTEELQNNIEQLPEEVQVDIKGDGDWLFGRGSMDMKAGLAIHMSILEKAAGGHFNGNILLVAVPDEEVHSAGMIGAVPILKELAEEYNLSYKACINAEPMFSKYPGDQNHYIYTGSIGKVLPSFLCVGKETHVGEPFAGINPNLIASEINREVELNHEFIEVLGAESSPPPTCLMQSDLKEGYSVQTPHSAVVMFNVLMMKRSVKETTDLLKRAAERAAQRVSEHYHKEATHFSERQASFKPNKIEIQVFTYKEVIEKVIDHYGIDEIQRRYDLLKANRMDEGDHEFGVHFVQELAYLINDEGPMVILYYNPPYYPAVYAGDHALIQELSQYIIKEGQTRFGMKFEEQHYFPGMSDLSFIGIQESAASADSLVDNMPLYGRGYTLPFEDWKDLRVPVINIGPLGRDPHQWTERVELNYTFGPLVELLDESILKIFSRE